MYEAQEILTICISYVSSASERGNNSNAHDHQEPVDDRNVDLAHESFRCMNYF